MRVVITIDGNEYPCMGTMGAYVRFEELRNKPVSAMEEGSAGDAVAFAYCCAAAGCAREKKEFPFTLMAFADMLEPAEFGEIVSALTSAPESGQKKTTS